LVAPVKVIPIPVSMSRGELREYSEVERRIQGDQVRGRRCGRRG